MKYEIIVTKAERQYVIADGCERLAVEAEIVVKGEGTQDEAHVRKFHYPLDTSQDAITADLQKVLEAFVNDREVAADSAALEKAQAQAEETAKGLTGAKLAPKEKGSDKPNN